MKTQDIVKQNLKDLEIERLANLAEERGWYIRRRGESIALVIEVRGKEKREICMSWSDEAAARAAFAMSVTFPPVKEKFSTCAKTELKRLEEAAGRYGYRLKCIEGQLYEVRRDQDDYSKALRCSPKSMAIQVAYAMGLTFNRPVPPAGNTSRVAVGAVRL